MVFMTGITGLIGSQIAKNLHKRGEKIRALIRPTSDTSLIDQIKDDIEFVEGDVLDVDVLEKALQDVDYVIHAAAIVSFESGGAEEMFKVNVEGTRNLVDVCTSLSLKKFLHVSSVAAIGRDKRTSEIDEQSKWVKSDLNSMYAVSKYLAELEVWRGVEEGLSAVIINPSVVFGPGDWSKSSTQLIKQVWKHPLLAPKGSLSFVDLRDVGNIAEQLLFSDVKSKRFIVSAGQISYVDLFTRLSRLLGKPSPKIEIGRKRATVYWLFSNLFLRLVGKKPLLTRQTIRMFGRHFQYRNDAIGQLLGYKFREIDKTLDWTVQGVVEKYNLTR